MNQNEPSIPPLSPAPKTLPVRWELHPLNAEPSLCNVLESILKSPGQVLHEIYRGRSFPVSIYLLAITLIGLTIYGTVVGCLVGGTQLWIAPVKIILGTSVALLICLPSLYVFLCLQGTTLQFRQIASALVAAACLTSLLLISFAPVAWIFSQSTNTISLMACLHLLFWAIAFCFGISLLYQAVATGRPDRGSRLPVWLAIYVIVSLQMMTALRPIIGPSASFLPQEKQFFLAHWIDTLNGKNYETAHR